MSPRKQKPRQGIQSVEVGARLLRALTQAGRPQMLRDLAAAAKMPAAKAHRYLVSFARAGLVQQYAETGLYDLGPFALELGLSALGRLDSMSIAAERLAALCEEIGQTVALAVWGSHGPTIVRWLGADTPVAATLRVGSIMPLTRSATGLAFLAFLPNAVTSRHVTSELAENSQKGLQPVNPEDLDRVVAQTRRLGFARTSEFIPGIGGMAAPIFDHSGAMQLALIALGYSKPFDAAFATISAAVVRAAASLSDRLGYRPAG